MDDVRTRLRFQKSKIFAKFCACRKINIRGMNSVRITVRQCTALRQGNSAGGGLADWRTDSAKNAALADWADWVHGPGVGPRWAEI